MAAATTQQKARHFTGRCLALDLEVGRGDGRIHRLALVRGGDRRSLCLTGDELVRRAPEVDRFAAGAEILVGHNLVRFDRPHLAAAAAELEILALPSLDTLWLNPLAFPRNPYHHLVKHYQDGQLRRSRRNDPELDGRLTLDLLADQVQALAAADGDFLLACHWLTTGGGRQEEALLPTATGMFWQAVRGAGVPEPAAARAALGRLLAGRGCMVQASAMAAAAGDQGLEGWALAFALAWITVAGENSVMPPWVWHQFPRAMELVHRLRATPCRDPACRWCREQHDPKAQLRRWFGFPDFRPEPADDQGRSLQGEIVRRALAGDHLLAILPTGAGKSLCYQLPALSRYHKTGSLTLVVSPLVALMADQVAAMERRNLDCVAALNGLLSMVERQEVLERLRLGDIAILLVAPEQLRSRTFRRALAQRRIGGWVLDEAHCLSKWGHDFRPDYRYVARFIREQAGSDPIPPILCLTATAKPDVVADIVRTFQEGVGVELAVLDGGADRTNLDFFVVPTTTAEKFTHVHQVLERELDQAGEGGAIVYCAFRRRTEELAAYLADKGWTAAAFHAGLPPEHKKTVQQGFLDGEIQVMVATNAFGMGIDKPDIRLVVHADLPGSLENYLQEAGRAGRDRKSARCVLLSCDDDIEDQFRLSAYARLSRREIQAILRALRALERRQRRHRRDDGEGEEVVATAGEILALEEAEEFDRDQLTDDTRVRTAIAWLEEARLLSREENRVQVFPSSLRVDSLAAARRTLARAVHDRAYRQRLERLVTALLEADVDEGVSTDELMGVTGLDSVGVRRALHDLETLGIAGNDTGITAFVHKGVVGSSRKRLQAAAAWEEDLIEELQREAPDLAVGEATRLSLRLTCQRLKDRGHPDILPETVWRLVQGLARDGRGDDGGGRGSLSLRRLDSETVLVRLGRDWLALRETARLRRHGGACLLEHFLARLPPAARGVDLLAATTLGELHRAVRRDLFLQANVRDVVRLVDRALLWLHELEILRLNKGLAVFRPAMTIRLARERRSFTKVDYTPLRLHYREKVVQVHVMAEYVARGLAKMAEARRLVHDYFRLQRDAFLHRWLPGRQEELARETTPESWRAIVEDLGDPAQQQIVAAGGQNTLVLAGPGSGKTRTLVHRIAYLVRVERVRPAAIIALAYNRHAAVEIRRRLVGLIGDDGRRVTVLTCHGLAMRLVGASFAGRDQEPESETFREIIRRAGLLLAGKGADTLAADGYRDRLLAGFSHILVDEYQDIDGEQYRLIGALAGRRLDEDQRLTIFAVGDDDQNIYGFDGASVRYIRRFQEDYQAELRYLVANYRSTGHIVAAANHVIQGCRTPRLKAAQQLVVDRRRAAEPAGGRWQTLDPVAGGRVQLLQVTGGIAAQGAAVVAELGRLANLDPDWQWSRVAVIARRWRVLEPVRALAEEAGIPVQWATELGSGGIPFWRLRETQALLHWLENRQERLVDGGALAAWLAEQGTGPWWQLLAEAVADFAAENGEAEVLREQCIDWLADWGRQARRRQRGLLLLTAHRAKGLEFDHVVVLDGDWPRRDPKEDVDAPRRLYYVAMTRARQTLTLVRLAEEDNPMADGLEEHEWCRYRRLEEIPVPAAAHRRYRLLTPAEVDLGFAGRFPAHHPVHGALAAARVGDPLAVERRGDRWLLVTAQGQAVGRLARRCTLDPAYTVEACRVAAVLRRRATDSDDAGHRSRARVASWEVVLPELVLVPAGPGETPGAAGEPPEGPGGRQPFRRR